jgi:GNAT superfamily N-acetyltransferase
MVLYRKLTLNDLDKFIELRQKQLQSEGAKPSTDLEKPLLAYYEKHICDGTFKSWVATDCGEIIATSGISFMEKPPTYGNPTGKFGIVSSMYTVEQYRRKGIAKKLLGLIVDEAEAYGCALIQVTASSMGVLLYQNFGFEQYDRFLQYKI